MNEKKEVESSKKIVTNEPKGGEKVVIGNVTVKPVKKIHKKHLIILATILLLVFSVILCAFLLSNRNTKNQEAQEDLNNIMATKPLDYEQQYEWSKKTSEQLENDTSYKNGNTETKTDYYNKLIGLYISQKSEQKARDLYMNEIHPQKIILNTNYLNWLYENYMLIENKQGAITTLEDLIIVYTNSLNSAEDEAEKTNTLKGIEDLKMKKQELEK